MSYLETSIEATSAVQPQKGDDTKQGKVCAGVSLRAGLRQEEFDPDGSSGGNPLFWTCVRQPSSHRSDRGCSMASLPSKHPPSPSPSLLKLPSIRENVKSGLAVHYSRWHGQLNLPNTTYEQELGSVLCPKVIKGWSNSWGFLNLWQPSGLNQRLFAHAAELWPENWWDIAP